MTTLHCDHRMNFPCDAITVLMVITCVLVYAIGNCILTNKLLQPSTCIFYIISGSIYLDTIYTHAVMWLV